MVEMTHSASASFLGSEFNDFLFAPIGEERNGMLLSVLSALARLDVDPWQEAAELARLTGEAATERLASMIAALPDGPSAPSDPRTIAARLVALLPRRASSNIRPRQTVPGVGTAIGPRTVMYVIFMVFVLGAQWVMTCRQPPAPVDNARAPASSTASTQMPPPSAGQ